MQRFMDDDMKIAPEKFSAVFEKQNPVADDNINLFISQRSNGNIDKANALAREFVAELLDCVWVKSPAGVETERFERQLKLLFSYCVHRIVEDYSLNSILANSTISSFYEDLEDADPTFFFAVSKSPAFTLYLYLHRADDEDAKTIGTTFAKLCNALENEECRRIGEQAYQSFLGSCAKKLLNVGYL